MEVYVYQDRVSIPEKKLKHFEFDWSNKSVLELGANVGKMGNYVLEKGASKYKGLELDKKMVEIGTGRYGLDLECMDVLKKRSWKTLSGGTDWDITIAMALFHHFTDKELERLFSIINSKVFIFEVPTGTTKTDLYYIRLEQSYAEMVKKCYGKVVEIVNSGATNDPYNKRVVFHCEKSI